MTLDTTPNNTTLIDMEYKTHPSAREARLACARYSKLVLELQDSCGVFEVHEDECADVWTCANWEDDKGDVRTMYQN